MAGDDDIEDGHDDKVDGDDSMDNDSDGSIQMNTVATFT